LAPRGEKTPYFVFSFAPAGIVAASGVDLVEAELLPMSIKRQAALDQDLSLRIELLRGRFRTTPSALTVEGAHAFYAELAVELLGYQLWRHSEARDDLHGVVLGGGSLHVGSVLGAHEGLSVSLYGGGAIDVTLLPSPPGGQVGYLSQMLALAGLRVAQEGGRFYQGFEAQLLAARQSHATPRWLSTPHYRGFVGASF
jgi:hypothetical protein